MSTRARSLRNTLTTGGLVAAGLIMVLAGMVGILTTLLRHATEVIESSVESIQLAEEAGIALVLHGQALHPLVKRDLAGRVRRGLAGLHEYAENESELALLDEANARVSTYMEASRDPERSEQEVSALRRTAYTALEEVVGINVTQARREARRSNDVNYVADVVAVVLSVLAALSCALFVYWVRGPALRPLFELSWAMEQFGRGDREVRARIVGPRELADMGSRFNDMATALARQRDDQQAFLAGVAHDLRSPLSAVRLATELARSDTSLPPENPCRSALDRIDRQLSRMERMVGDFLDAAHIEAGQLELRFEQQDLRGTLETVVGLFDGSSAQHQLVLCMPDDPVVARFDPLRIEQVATNLISNAIKYSPAGGRIDVRLQRAADTIVLEVADRGLGISREQQRRLFEPFQRGSSLAATIPGVGLGLYVVRRIVEAHGGVIEVESRLGMGSTFRVRLPTSPPVSHEP